MKAQRHKILIVEDDAIISLTIEHTLKKLGYAIDGITVSGEECLEIMEKKSPDLVLMDIQLAGTLDGIQTASVIKEKYETPVVFLTAYSSEDIMERARLSEPFGYIIKPFNEKDLFTTIELSLHRAELNRVLLNSERRFRDISVSADHIVIETDAEGKITYLNPYGERILGTGDHTQEQNNLFDFIETEKHRELIKEKLLNKKTNGQEETAEIQIRSRTGRIFFFEEQLKTVGNASCGSGLRGILFNVTKRKYKQAIQQAILELSDLLRGDMISNDGFIFYVIKLLQKLTGACSVSFNRYDTSGGSFFTYEQAASSAFDSKMEYPLLESVAQKMQPMFLRGNEINRFFEENRITGEKVQALSWIGIPIQVGTDLFGILVIASLGSPDFFSAEDFEIFIDSCHEISFIFQNIAFRNKARENETRYRNLVESIDEGIVIINYSDETLSFFNKKFLEILELSDDIQPGLPWKDLYFVKDNPGEFENMDFKRQQNIPGKSELCFKTPSGKEKCLLVSSSPVYGNNGNTITGSMSILVDITEKRESERRIREGGERLNEIVQHIKEAFWLIDWKSRTILYGSPSFSEIYGTGFEELQSHPDFWFGLAHPDDTYVREKFFSEAAAGKYDVQYRLESRDGRIKWVHERAFPIIGADGNVIRIAGYSLDISEQKTAQLDLARSENNMKAIINTIPDSLVIVTNDGIVRDYYGKENVGETADDHNYIGKPFCEILNKDNHRKVRLLFRKFVAGEEQTPTSFTIHDKNSGNWFELRFMHIDKKRKLILIRNVTTEKKQENELRKFFNLVEQSEEIIMITDSKGMIEYVNPKFSEVTGFEPEEVLGKIPRLLNSGKHSRAFFRNFWKTIVNGKPFSGELINRKKNGEIYIEAKFVTPLFNENNEIVNFISTGRDITEQKETEQKLEAYRKLQEYQEKKQARIRTLSLLQGQEEERKRIARELHDGLGQILSATKIYLERIGTAPGENLADSPDLPRVHQMVVDTIHEVRRISNDLSPSGLHDFGLLAAIRNLVAKLGETMPNIRFQINTNLDRLRFKNNVEINVFRILQEAMNNAVKHSGASKIELNLFHTDTHLRVSVMDDGSGFNTSEIMTRRSMNTAGSGLTNMHERAKIIGGKLMIVTEKDSGVLISFELKTLPVKK